VQQFALMIKKLREERKLSQKDIADHLGVTRQAVNSYECGRREPDFKVLIKLADYFGVTVDYLLGRTTERNVNIYVNDKNLGVSETNNKEGNTRDEIINKEKLDFMDSGLVKWVMDKNNLQYIKFARYVQSLDLPLESIKSVLDVMKSVQNKTERDEISAK